MLTFTIIALRIVGLWLVATRVGEVLGTTFYAFGLFGYSAEPESVYAGVAILLIPVLGGIALIMLARPIARLIVPPEGISAEQPVALSERGFTQVAVFVVGIAVLADATPNLAAAALSEEQLGYRVTEMGQLMAGLVLVFGSGLFGGLVGWLRRWP